ncbi:bifunctional adenosylcobinamide kinase/adenosylcobinamide-phosphate guanylyltransferase [Dietzia cercidiphylli]|uniref:bifunctional adenosylcobinamide kinase/adenosylcobinamide-phosphate guanylyltransferase n=1 Tax=Dietzia cercidiphylli TaxID=498199 RepID=UPI00223ADD03|nr:bifunctional adenosylcobinamide kinase/adenosylcobinamide-phosphate guanylyltransferase [Dietzia cercidiphylli]MCT1514037.1 bifunctional adenosylcobinamide kinase/adenosylcobinamide-phosphate guanylyltransferase [Dietzia cercidiphylli]
MRVLVTGGVRSGKSRHAVGLLEGRDHVTVVAPGPVADGGDPDWDHRVARHRAHRPTGWETVETVDLASAIGAAAGPVLVDCLGTWVTAILDRAELWDAPMDAAHGVVDQHVAAVREAVKDHDDEVVLVTNEVGYGVVPSHRSGGVFRDLLGAVNQGVAEACDEVHLVVCGRVLRL